MCITRWSVLLWCLSTLLGLVHWTYSPLMTSYNMHQWYWSTLIQIADGCLFGLKLMLTCCWCGNQEQMSVKLTGIRFVFMNSKVYLCKLCSGPGGRFKTAYELLNLRALKISMLYKNCIFQCMGKIFCVEFQRVPLKFHTKYFTHTLKDVDFIQRWKFKSS